MSATARAPDTSRAFWWKISGIWGVNGIGPTSQSNHVSPGGIDVVTPHSGDRETLWSSTGRPRSLTTRRQDCACRQSRLWGASQKPPHRPGHAEPVLSEEVTATGLTTGPSTVLETCPSGAADQLKARWDASILALAKARLAGSGLHQRAQHHGTDGTTPLLCMHRHVIVSLCAVQ